MRVNLSSNNFFLLIGNVSKVNEFSEGKAANISIAISNGKDKKGNQRETTFIETKCFSPAVYSIVKVGQKVQILGHLSSGTYEKDGKTIYSTDIISDSVIFLESKAVSEARDKKKESTEKKTPIKKAVKSSVKRTTGKSKASA